MMEELEAKIRQPPTTYFISAHHVKASKGEVSSAARREPPLLPSSVITTKCDTQAEHVHT